MAIDINLRKAPLVPAKRANASASFESARVMQRLNKPALIL
jgi:hypothetical protein